MDITELVRSFNALPRTPTVPQNDSNNHWHFSIRAVEPQAFYLHIIHAGHFDHIECPLDIPLGTAPSTEDFDGYLYIHMWRSVLPFLLDVFNSNFGLLNFYSKVTTFAPWSWSTDKLLVPAVERVLKEVGVRQELCVVTAGDPRYIERENVQWLEKVLSLQDPKCENCKNTASPGKKLMLCAACKRPHYCSKACQKAAWKAHKDSCAHYKTERLRKEGAKFTTAWAVQYHSIVAPNMPDAIDLAQEINLTFQKFRGIE